MSATSGLRIATIPDVNLAVGVAARMMMDHPAFGGRPFGEWTRVLDGQARRGHQYFVFDATDRAVGLAGYAWMTEALAEAWAAGRLVPTYDQCRTGDCVVFNAWIAQDVRVHRFMWSAGRELCRDSKAVFFKRFYADGRIRPARLAVTEAVKGHIRRTIVTRETEAAQTAAVSTSET